MNKSSRFLEPLALASTPSIIADKIRDAIAHGDIPAGAQLYEAELARTFGVSRGPLREGLQRLTQEGLLVAIRNRGVFVIEMTAENVRDMYAVRGAVERAALQLIFQRDPTAAGTSLDAICDEMARAAGVDDRSEVDIRFHEELVGLSESPRLRRVHRTVITETRMCIHALAESYALSDDRVAEHRAIARAVTGGDSRTADRLMIEHMEDAVARLVPAES
ncbi:GntR family transcriptional regulator [Microlunatus sp. Gsoil 973]|jgi:DNA-binding GntR family transcriptional regulator|uniref:GntR family transcriptional regulator n=1 Tax=Microlunatus sp. Gsoil 973 TaxID=2672569 RepID=UPI0012B4594E|nr:GntR family transcriptional regulator [Microlunatus sp. Gsoil 973]QGN33057.1 FCD domain-containing protein [Microlunatus sp. Gsoil 973]